MTERIDERLEVMGVDTAGMTNEQKFTAATGLTRYTEYEANNAWYVPGGAANVPSGTEEPVGPAGQPKVETYTAAEAVAYNAQLEGAVSTDDYKVKPVEGVKYTQEEVLAANAVLEGALKAGKPLTEEQAAAYNIAVTGTTKETGDELTTEEAAMYNAHLEGAISTDGYKVKPVEGVKYTQEGADTYNAKLDGAVKEGDPKTSSAEIVTE